MLQGIAVAAVVWISSMGEDAAAKTKKKSKHGKHPAASASASDSASPSAVTATSASGAARAEPAASASASSAPVASAASSETTQTPEATPPPSAASAATSPADAAAASARPTFRDVMLEGVGGLIFGAVPLLAGSGGLLVLSNGSGDRTGAYIALGAATYGAFIPMTALGVSFAGHLLDVHGTFLGAFLGSAIGTAIAAAPTAVLVFEGTRGATVDGAEVISSLYAVPMLLGTIGAVIGWEVSVPKAPKATALRRGWVVPGVTPSPYGTMLTLSGAF